jgi:hypothetical protein
MVSECFGGIFVGRGMSECMMTTWWDPTAGYAVTV